MKKILLFLFCLINLQAHAQLSIFAQNDSLTIQGRTYLCETIGSIVHVNNKNNLSATYEPEGYKDCLAPSRLNVNEALAKVHLQNVVTPVRRLQLQNIYKYIPIAVYIKPSTGVVQEVAFTFGIGTPITLEEIYKIELALVGKVLATPRPECEPLLFVSKSIEIDW
jgi:hypothetical protein